MKKSFVIAGVLFASLTAQADMVVKMDLDLTCTEAQGSLFGEGSVHVFADGKKTVVTIQNKAYVGPEMFGGTEGGPFYSDYFDNKNGIAIRLGGADLEKMSYDTKSIPNATVEAHFTHANTSKSLTCKGRLGWTN